MTEKEEAAIAGRDDHKFTLRLTERLHREIYVASVREGRSVNTEILLRLERTLEDERKAMRAQMGLIAFMAGCVEELAARLPAPDLEDTRVQLMLELARSITSSEE